MERPTKQGAMRDLLFESSWTRVAGLWSDTNKVDGGEVETEKTDSTTNGKPYQDGNDMDIEVTRSATSGNLEFIATK